MSAAFDAAVGHTTRPVPWVIPHAHPRTLRFALLSNECPACRDDAFTDSPRPPPPRYMYVHVAATDACAALGLGLGVARLLFATQLSLDVFFGCDHLTVATTDGWLHIMLLLLCAAVGAVHLVVVVERSKKCLDFALTVHILHCGLCIWYRGFPSVPTWWIVNLVSVVVMTLLGERACQYLELQDIDVAEEIRPFFSASFSGFAAS